MTLVEDEPPTDVAGVTWVKVRTTITRTDGWVALNYLFIEREECLDRVQ